MHYMAPEGGYATDPDGAERTLEFRQMVQARADALSLVQHGLLTPILSITEAMHAR